MGKAKLPRLGTSGSANAYVVFLGSEFGTQSTPQRPQYSELNMGARDWLQLWRLRVGEPNAHFDERWATYRINAALWRNLFVWLPDAFSDARLAHSMFAWLNLAVTEGGPHVAPQWELDAGMREYAAPFVEASGAKCVLASNKRTGLALDRWAHQAGGTRTTIDDMEAWRFAAGPRRLVAATIGHPSRGTTRTDFTRRLRAAVSSAEQLPQ
jgi:hypothetical protein